MYSVIFSDKLQIIHSLPGSHFGQAQNPHGNTYLIHIEIFASELDEYNQVIDNSVAKQIISKVLGLYNYKHLDTLAELNGKITTHTFLASFIAEKVERQLSLIDIPNKTINQIKVSVEDTASSTSSFWKRIE